MVRFGYGRGIGGGLAPRLLVGHTGPWDEEFRFRLWKSFSTPRRETWYSGKIVDDASVKSRIHEYFTMDHKYLTEEQSVPLLIDPNRFQYGSMFLSKTKWGHYDFALSFCGRMDSVMQADGQKPERSLGGYRCELFDECDLGFIGLHPFTNEAILHLSYSCWEAFFVLCRQMVRTLDPPYAFGDAANSIFCRAGPKDPRGVGWGMMYLGPAMVDQIGLGLVKTAPSFSKFRESTGGYWLLMDVVPWMPTSWNLLRREMVAEHLQLWKHFGKGVKPPGPRVLSHEEYDDWLGKASAAFPKKLADPMHRL